MHKKVHYNVQKVHSLINDVAYINLDTVEDLNKFAIQPVTQGMHVLKSPQLIIQRKIHFCTQKAHLPNCLATGLV